VSHVLGDVCSAAREGPVSGSSPDTTGHPPCTLTDDERTTVERQAREHAESYRTG
jgi:hypothetical protein